MSCKFERIGGLGNLLDKERNSSNTEKQDLQKLIAHSKKQIEDLKQSISCMKLKNYQFQQPDFYSEAGSQKMAL
jgi:hypothetical protein